MRACLAALPLLLAPALAHAEDIRTAVVAGGCFWCVEADFEKVDGVKSAVSGYAGGTTEDPTYKEVTYGTTGHMEAVEITYDADVLSYERLVELFLRSIDPTDDGGQFCDRGPSYRTAIFTSTPEEHATAEAELAKAAEILGAPIATDLRDAATFHVGEEYHQDYYKKNPVRYSAYRNGCGRDLRVRSLWGDAAITEQIG